MSNSPIEPVPADAEPSATIEDHVCDDWMYVAYRVSEDAGEDRLTCALCRLRTSPRVQPSEPDALEQVKRLSRCLGFFASVIKSGEGWSEACQAEYDRATGATRVQPSGEHPLDQVIDAIWPPDQKEAP